MLDDRFKSEKYLRVLLPGDGNKTTRKLIGEATDTFLLMILGIFLQFFEWLEEGGLRRDVKEKTPEASVRARISRLAKDMEGARESGFVQKKACAVADMFIADKLWREWVKANPVGEPRILLDRTFTYRCEWKEFIPPFPGSSGRGRHEPRSEDFALRLRIAVALTHGSLGEFVPAAYLVWIEGDDRAPWDTSQRDCDGLSSWHSSIPREIRRAFAHAGKNGISRRIHVYPPRKRKVILFTTSEPFPNVLVEPEGWKAAVKALLKCLKNPLRSASRVICTLLDELDFPDLKALLRRQADLEAQTSLVKIDDPRGIDCSQDNWWGMEKLLTATGRHQLRNYHGLQAYDLPEFVKERRELDLQDGLELGRAYLAREWEVVTHSDHELGDLTDPRSTVFCPLIIVRQRWIELVGQEGRFYLSFEDLDGRPLTDRVLANLPHWDSDPPWQHVMGKDVRRMNDMLIADRDSTKPIEELRTFIHQSYAARSLEPPREHNEHLKLVATGCFADPDAEVE